MNYDRQLQASFWVMMAVQAVNGIDMPGKGPRKLPSPRGFVAGIVVWAILGLVSDAGASKAAAAMGWVTVLAGMVLGPFGTITTHLFKTVSTKFAVAPVSPSDSGNSGGGGGSVSGSGPIIS